MSPFKPSEPSEPSKKNYRIDIYCAGSAPKNSQTEYNSQQASLKIAQSHVKLKLYPEALTILTSKEMENNPQAQRMLGEMYTYGYGVKKTTIWPCTICDVRSMGVKEMHGQI